MATTWSSPGLSVCAAAAQHQRLRLSADKDVSQIKRDRKTITRSRGGPVSNHATSGANDGRASAPISGRTAAMAVV